MIFIVILQELFSALIKQIVSGYLNQKLVKARNRSSDFCLLQLALKTSPIVAVFFLPKSLLENQVGEQEHAAANVWGIQVDKLATQQIGDELQLQENEFNIAIHYARNKIKRTLKRELSTWDFGPYILASPIQTNVLYPTANRRFPGLL